MALHDEINQQKQLIARCEKSLALERIKQRRADTRRKIEYGGLIIKSGIYAYNKAVILGALAYALKQIEQDDQYIKIFESMGTNLFLNSKEF
jgi:hypothetical protein